MNEQHLNLPEQQSLDINGSFFEQHSDKLNQLFDILQMPRVTDLDSAVAATQPWVAGDHFNPDRKSYLSGELADKARQVYERMGLVQEAPLPAGEYDQIIVLGALQRANHARLQFLGKSLKNGVVLADGGKLVLWGGERPINQQFESSFIEADLHKTKDVDNAWLSLLRSGEAQIEDEADALRLALLADLGNFELTNFHHKAEESNEPDYYELKNEDGLSAVVLHSPAVERPQGKPRHTTEECAKHWLATQDVPEGATVGFIAHNPYLRRTARVVQSVLDSQGRPDIKLVPAGAAAYPDAGKDYVFLGEIARNLYEDTHNNSSN